MRNIRLCEGILAYKYLKLKTELGDGIGTLCAVESYEKAESRKCLTLLISMRQTIKIFFLETSSNSKRNPFRELENAAMGFPKNDNQFSHIRV